MTSPATLAALAPTTGLAAVVAGFALGLSIIVAVGAQNAYVLRQGIRREHVLAIVLICALSDLVLITISISGMGLLIAAAPWVITAVRIAGAIFLIVYGVLAARRALARTAEVLTAAPDETTRRRSLLAAVGTCLAVTWLNPHVYMDITLVGSIANSHGDARWLFGAGVAAASAVWFTTLGFGARVLAPLFARPLAWRILDGAIAIIMLTVAVFVALPLFISAPR